MKKKEQPDYFYIVDKILLVTGLTISLYRKYISESSVFFRLHITPLILSTVCFWLCTLVFGKKINRYAYFDSQVYIPIIAIFATIAAIYDQIKNFM